MKPACFRLQLVSPELHFVTFRRVLRFDQLHAGIRTVGADCLALQAPNALALPAKAELATVLTATKTTIDDNCLYII